MNKQEKREKPVYLCPKGKCAYRVQRQIMVDGLEYIICPIHGLISKTDKISDDVKTHTFVR